MNPSNIGQMVNDSKSMTRNVLFKSFNIPKIK